jgi:predicted PurR-regulated permease PerM
MPVFRTDSYLAPLLLACLVTAILFLGQAFLMPLALAILIAFLLTPLVSRLQAAGLPCVPAVIAVAILAFSLIGAGTYVVATQLSDLTRSLPAYQENFRIKVVEPMSRVSAGVTKIKKELDQPAASTPEKSPGEKPMPVELVSGKVSVIAVVRDILAPILAPFGTAAVVVVLVLFLLIERQDLRDRFIHLVGRRRLNVTTQAIDDAANRVSRYLGAQLIVNVTYGIPIGIGLYFIGIPNAALWGLLAIVLRFIPYLGPWIAASFPVLLSVAVSPGWTQPIATVALFIVIELISNNAVEPWLYGSSTGLSPTAVVVSAVFWTWLWGAGGLLLATPLTVCLAVLGKYVPQLTFLDILLGDRPPIAPESRFYQRLLAGDETELYDMVNDYADRDALPDLFDNVILPALHLAELDLASGNLSPDEQKDVNRNLHDALATIDGFKFESNDEHSAVVIVPMRSEGDALAGAMLAHLVRTRGLTCSLLSQRQLASEVQAELHDQPDVLVCASTLSLTGARIAISLFKRLNHHLRSRILGYWLPEDIAANANFSTPELERATTLDEALRYICSKAGGIAAEDESGSGTNSPELAKSATVAA